MKSVCSAVLLLALCLLQAASAFHHRSMAALSPRLHRFESLKCAETLSSSMQVDVESIASVEAAVVPEAVKNEFEGLRRYKEIYGNLNVPDSFRVPGNDNQWPIDSWGLELGKTLTNIKTTDNYDIYRSELESIGFRYNTAVQSDDEDEKNGLLGGIEPGKILNFALYGYIAYLTIDTIRILVMSRQ